MARNRIRMDGLDELKAQMRRLPAELSGEARTLVLRAADEAKVEISRSYPGRTGNLKKGLQVIKTSSPFGTKALVKNTAPHAALFEFGTQARHTEIGANRGSMPVGNVFIPIAIRKRREMFEQIVELIRQSGAAKVTGA